MSVRTAAAAALTLAFLTALPAPSFAATFSKSANGITLNTSSGATRIQICTESVARVTHSPSARMPQTPSLAVTAQWKPVRWHLTEAADELTIATSKLKIHVDRSTGRVRFCDTASATIVSELPGGTTLTPAKLGEENVYTSRQQFAASPGEAYYGLGCMQVPTLDYRGQRFQLYQQNTVDISPVLLSSKGYGILWDNPSTGEIDVDCDRFVIPQGNLFQPEGQPGGLRAEYFADTQLQALKTTRTDREVNFTWWRAPAEGLQRTGYSVRWTGQFLAAKTGTHKFSVDCGGGVRLWVDGRLLIDRWTPRPISLTSEEMRLEAGRKYDVKMEYFQAEGQGSAKLYWHLPIDVPSVTWSSEVAEAVDYYFMYGPEFDDVIASYRVATGKAPMFGKWAYGLWQCKEHYHTQQELLDVAATYREKKIPLDAIVQDWYYWNPEPWGSHSFDPERYPDMAGAIETLHEQNLKVMISVWPKFDPGSKNYDELTSIGGLFPATPPCAAYYDPFNPAAREMYWRQLKDQLFSKGIDAWWLDATEPEYNWPIHPGVAREFKTGMGLGGKVWSAYPLMTTKAVYEGQRAETDEKRVYILTRSSYAGIQRHASVVWSGDIVGTWDVFRDQIASGLNFCMTGIPYWATDIGGFTSGNPQDPAYRELYLRWFQWGTFCPIFRIHGTTHPKEMWRFGPEAEAIQVKFDHLRYRLLPYIYSTAWMVTDQGYTMMRALPMDFRTDNKALGIWDQFMFGPALLINPITRAGATSRKLYLPTGTTWYDFWTGERTEGGVTIDSPAPIESMPIYVRAGSIIPMGPFIQYSTEKPADPIELRVYPGANGSSTIYEDENDNYNYEEGAYATIPITWDEEKQTLTIGKRQGSFPGMLQTRTFKIVWVREGHGTGLDEEGNADQTVNYDGRAVSVRR